MRTYRVRECTRVCLFAGIGAVLIGTKRVCCLVNLLYHYDYYLLRVRARVCVQRREKV